MKYDLVFSMFFFWIYLIYEYYDEYKIFNKKWLKFLKNIFKWFVYCFRVWLYGEVENVNYS